jgi:hypothetical protein
VSLNSQKASHTSGAKRNKNKLRFRIGNQIKFNFSGPLGHLSADFPFERRFRITLGYAVITTAQVCWQHIRQFWSGAFVNVVIVHNYWQLCFLPKNANARPASMAWNTWSNIGDSGVVCRVVGACSGSGWSILPSTKFPRALCWSMPRTLLPATQPPILTS